MAEDFHAFWLRVRPELAQVAKAFDTMTKALPGTLRKLIDHKLSIEKAQYKIDKNPLHAWMAYRLSRLSRVPTPEWVLEYFDRCAAGFDRARHEEKIKKPSVEIARAMEMHSMGRGNVFSNIAEWEDPKEWPSLSYNVLVQLTKGDKEDYAVAAVAKLSGVSPSTVYRALRRAKKHFSRRVPISFTKSTTF